MCKFCCEDWNQRHTVQAKTDGVFSSYGGMQVENGCISVNVGGSVARFPVNSCPICGRKLEETPRVPESEYKMNGFVVPWEEENTSNLTYTAFLYEEDGKTSADFYTFDDKDEAIEYAKTHRWDEVVEDGAGTVVWKSTTPKKETKTLLIKTDGYSVSTSEFESKTDAFEEMKKQYLEVFHGITVNEFVGLSSIDEDDAIAYNNGEAVYVWKIVVL